MKKETQMETVRKSAVHILGAIALITLFTCVAVASIPYWRQMQCIWSNDEVCITDHQQAELHERDQKIEELESELASFKRLNTKLIEGDIDPMTIFKSYEIEGTDREVTVGTIYEKLIGEDVTYADYYCYVEIQDDDGVASNLFIRTRGEFVKNVNYEIGGLSSGQYDVAKNLCQPLELNELTQTAGIYQ